LIEAQKKGNTMHNAPAISTIELGKFIIEASAEQHGELWFPTFQISTGGLVVQPWQSPDVPGLSTEHSALEIAVETAVHRVASGLGALFS
jgi:hypothetical protein